MLPERRYAEWRLLPERGVPALWVGAGAGLAVCALLFAASRQFNYGFVFLAGFVSKLVSSWVVSRRMEALRDDPRGGQFAAGLLLSREAPYGIDEGLVAFEDGWLVFTGRRCTFSVGRADVEGVKFERSRLEFSFAGPGGTFSAQLDFRSADDLKTAVQEWRREGRRSEGTMLPPVVPNEPARRTIRAIPQVAFAVLLLALVALWIWGVGEGAIAGLILGGTCLLIGLLYTHDATAALRRIERGEPQGFAFGHRPVGRRSKSLAPRNPQ